MRLLVLLSFVPAILAAQLPDSGSRAIALPITDSALRLPTDRVGGLLGWIPGGTLDPDGRPTWHGRPEAMLGRSVDGVYWGSVFRIARMGSRNSPFTMAPAFNALAKGDLLSGAYSVGEGAGGPGLLRFSTKGGTDHWSGQGGAESESPFMADGGSGISRFEGAVGGPLTGGWRIRAVATLLGQQALPTGAGLASAPYYVPVGTDTTYAWQYPTPGDTVTGAVQRFGASDRAPTSPLTTTDIAGRLDGHLGGATVWAHYLRSTAAERLFDYQSVSDQAQSFGRDGRDQDLAVGIALPPLGGWSVRGEVSWQEERMQQGPIDPTTQLASRDPGLGILTGGIGLRYTLDNFPVDDQLQWNYRLNTPGSRRSPYDLENTAQYALIDQYRNNAYGLPGFTESGGPLGTLTLRRDRRLGGQVTGMVPLGTGALSVGAEVRGHDIASYSHSLASQAFSDVWLAKPVEQALFTSWTTGGNTWSLTAGLRLDRFNTRARRPRMLPRLSSFSSGYVDPSSGDTLRWARGALSQEQWYDLNTDPDQAHTALSPRISAWGDVGNGIRLHGSVGRLARTPDLARQLSGINTDLAITNIAQVYGTDYGHEITDVFEAGIEKAFARSAVEVTLFRERDTKTPLVELQTFFDPVTLTTRQLAVSFLDQGATYTGVTVTGGYRPADWLHLRGSFTHIGTSGASQPPLVIDGQIVGQDSVRPNTLALLAEARSGSEGALRGMGAIVSLRMMSGLARDASTPTGVAYAVRDGSPAWKLLDLRVTKDLALAGASVTFYLDARNLLNAQNLLRAFGGGDPKDPGLARNARWSADSSSSAQEASYDGVYNSGTGAIDLTYSGAGRAACGSWVKPDGTPAPPNCAYLIAAEQRFGNGDGVFTLAEQHAASTAYFDTQFGPQTLLAQGRAIRLGARIGF